MNENGYVLLLPSGYRDTPTVTLPRFRGVAPYSEGPYSEVANIATLKVLETASARNNEDPSSYRAQPEIAAIYMLVDPHRAWGASELNFFRQESNLR